MCPWHYSSQTSEGSATHNNSIENSVMEQKPKQPQRQETKSSRRHEQANNQSPRKHTHILPHHKPSPLHFLTKIPGRLVQRENLFSKHVFTNHRDPFPSSLGLPCPRVVSSSSLVIFVIYFLHFFGLVFFVLFVQCAYQHLRSATLRKMLMPMSSSQRSTETPVRDAVVGGGDLDTLLLSIIKWGRPDRSRD